MKTLNLLKLYKVFMPKKFRKRELSLGYIKLALKTMNTPKTFSEFYKDSTIKHKHSFLIYIKWLTEKGFIIKKRQSILVKEVGNMGYNQTRRVTIYSITDKGLEFLEMIT